MPTKPSPALERLGEMLVRRRIELNPAYRNRQAFVRERGAEYKVVSDIETGRRSNFEVATLASLEAAYELAPGSIKRAMDGGELESAQADHPKPRPGRFQVVEDSGGEFQDSRDVAARSVDLVAAVLGPTIADLRAAIETARAVNPDAAGPDIFEDATLAEVWDMTRLSETDRLIPMAYYLLRKRRETGDPRKAI